MKLLLSFLQRISRFIFGQTDDDEDNENKNKQQFENPTQDQNKPPRKFLVINGKNNNSPIKNIEKHNCNIYKKYNKHQNAANFTNNYSSSITEIKQKHLSLKDKNENGSCNPKEEIFVDDINNSSGDINDKKFNWYDDNNEHINSKSIQYAGLQNQGATCYMNAILQMLFHIPIFRKLVYKVNKYIDNDIIILNLQSLFASLQMTREAGNTKQLTDSFGWNELDVRTQNDAEEFLRVFLDFFNNKLQNTKFSKKILDYFGVDTHTIITNTQENSVHFFDEYSDTILFQSLTIKNFKNIYDSLDYECCPQMLTGNNKYDSALYGKQDAILTQQFTKFPKILLFHLKRFEITEELNIKKINSRFEFYDKINLEKYLSKKENCLYSPRYELHGVIVHRGSANSGHYYAYLRPTIENKWFKFNDSFVSETSSFDAIENNYGSDNEEKSYNAYILLYARIDSLSKIYCEVPDDIIPGTYLNKIKKPIFKVKLIDQENLAINALNGRISFLPKTENDLISFELSSLKELYSTISSNYNRPSSHFTLWTFEDSLLDHKIKENTTFETNGKNEIMLFMSEFEVEKSEKLIIIFLYIPTLHHPMRFLTTIKVKPSDMIYSSVEPILLTILNVSSEQINLYSKFVHVLVLLEKNAQFNNLKSSFLIVQLQIKFDFSKLQCVTKFNDDISYSDNSICNYLDFIPIPKSPDKFYELITNLTKKKLKIIRSLNEIEKHNVSYPSFINFSKFYQFLKNAFELGEYFDIFLNNSIQPIKPKDDDTIFEQKIKKLKILPSLSTQKLNDQFLIEIKISIDSIYINDTIFLNFLDFSVPINIIEVKDLLEVVQTKIAELRDKDLRLLQIKNSKIQSIIQNNALIYNLENPLRVEPIPKNQIFQRLIPVSFYEKKIEPSSFLLSLKENESFSKTKERIQHILDKTDNGMNTLDFKLLNKKDQFLPLKDDDLLDKLIDGELCQIIISSKDTQMHHYNFMNLQK